VANFPEIFGVTDAGDGVRSRSQLIERKIEALEDMATKVRKLIRIGAAFYLLLPFFVCLWWMIQSNRRASLVMRSKNENVQKIASFCCSL
jgi:hypothetical protein